MNQTWNTMTKSTPSVHADDLFLSFMNEGAVMQEINKDLSAFPGLMDITREQLFHSKPKERESLANLFFKQTTQLAWVVDEDANLRFANQSFFRFFGIEDGDHLGKKITDIVPASIVNTLYDQHLEVLKTDKPLNLNHRVQWTDGNDFISYINLFPLTDHSGKKLLGGQAIPMPGMSRLEKELEEAQERLLNLNKATIDTVWEWDIQADRILQNDRLLEMTGYRTDTTRKASWWVDRVHPEDRQRVIDKVNKAIGSGQQSWQDEYRFKCADGNYKHFRDRAFIIYENDKPVKMIGSMHDISGLKDLERKLAEERMRRQKEVSEAVISAQEQERTSIGRELHDNVNQLLSATKLFVDVLEPADSTQKLIKQKTIDYIQLSIDEIRKLSNELVAPSLKEKDLIGSIHQMVNDLSLASSVKIRFIHDFITDHLAPGKKITLFRIVQEQLKNIIKHSQAENTVISLQSCDGRLELAIIDDGVGFNPKQTHRGIGLSNIQERVKFYNGFVEITAAPGEGCTMIVSLPE